VLAREDKPGDKQLVAYLLADSTEQPLDDELRRFLQTRLPGYMLPTAFVSLAEWPLTANGKVDRRALPAPDLQRSVTTKYLAPGSDVERTIAAAWQEVLRIDRIGTNDNFFDFGGHSLLLAQVHSRLRRQLRRDISMIELFRFPTIGSLAAHLIAASDGSASVRQGQERAKARQAAWQRRQQQREVAREK
jgi:acyl carrier protein